MKLGTVRSYAMNLCNEVGLDLSFFPQAGREPKTHRRIAKKIAGDSEKTLGYI